MVVPIVVEDVEERLVLILIVLRIAKLVVVLADVVVVEKVVALLVADRVHPIVLVPPMQDLIENTV